MSFEPLLVQVRMTFNLICDGKYSCWKTANCIHEFFIASTCLPNLWAWATWKGQLVIYHWQRRGQFASCWSWKRPRSSWVQHQQVPPSPSTCLCNRFRRRWKGPRRPLEKASLRLPCTTSASGSDTDPSNQASGYAKSSQSPFAPIWDDEKYSTLCSWWRSRLFRTGKAEKTQMKIMFANRKLIKKLFSLFSPLFALLVTQDKDEERKTELLRNFVSPAKAAKVRRRFFS